MTERKKYLIQLHLNDENKDVAKCIDDFESISNSLFHLNQSLFENKEVIKYHQREIEKKYFRFGLGNHSIINLIKGNKFIFNKKPVHFVDLSSINNITRMQIESFLIMYYLFFDDISDLDKDFRYDIYKLHGLQKQSNFKIHDKERNQIHLDRISSELNEAIENVKKSETYKAATEKEKLNFLNPRYAKIVKSETLFKKSGIEKMRIDEIWNVYSNYAHSEYISDRQFNSAFNNKAQIIGNCINVININSILSAKLISFLMTSFESVKNEFDKFTEKEKIQIEVWAFNKKE